MLHPYPYPYIGKGGNIFCDVPAFPYVSLLSSPFFPALHMENSSCFAPKNTTFWRFLNSKMVFPHLFAFVQSHIRLADALLKGKPLCTDQGNSCAAIGSFLSFCKAARNARAQLSRSQR